MKNNAQGKEMCGIILFLHMHDFPSQKMPDMLMTIAFIMEDGTSYTNTVKSIRYRMKIGQHDNN